MRLTTLFVVTVILTVSGWIVTANPDSSLNGIEVKIGENVSRSPATTLEEIARFEGLWQMAKPQLLSIASYVVEATKDVFGPPNLQEMTGTFCIYGWYHEILINEHEKGGKKNGAERVEAEKQELGIACRNTTKLVVWESMKIHRGVPIFLVKQMESCAISHFFCKYVRRSVVLAEHYK